MTTADIQFGNWELPEDTKGHRFNTSSVIDGYVDRHGFLHILTAVQCSACAKQIHLGRIKPGSEVIDLDSFPTCEAADWKNFTYTLDVEVPSGKLYLTDDFRPKIDTDGVMNGEYLNYNSIVERIGYAKKLNTQYGMAYAAVGNTCPSVETLSDGSLIVRQTLHEDDPQFNEEYEYNLPSITTDLWAVSAIDYDKYVALTGSEPDISLTGVIMNVTPGVYKVTVNSENYEVYQYSSTQSWLEPPELLMTFELA